MSGSTAFVLGGGGVRGAVEIGMVRALFEAGITPDLIVGTSIGAINGALIASDPTLAVIDKLLHAWTSPEASAVYGDSLVMQIGRLVKTKTHLNSSEPLRALLERSLGRYTSFADLQVPLQVVAASIERAAEHVFDSGPLIDAVVASAAVPGLFPAAEIDGEHFIDGGIVNSIPIEQALTSGARTIYVLQVGRVETPLVAPSSAVDTARVAFEIARRHRFARDLATLPDDVDLYMLPSGGPIGGDDSIRSYRRMDTVRLRIDQAYEATRDFLADRGLAHPAPAPDAAPDEPEAEAPGDTPGDVPGEGV